MAIIDTSKITEQQELAIASEIAKMCKLKRKKDDQLCMVYHLGSGWGTKTDLGLARSVLGLIIAQVETDHPAIDWTRIKHDANGNARHVCHFLALLTEAEKDLISDVGAKYAIAIKRANKIGGRKFHNERYWGGIVFQCSDPFNEIEPYIEQAIKDAQK